MRKMSIQIETGSREVNELGEEFGNHINLQIYLKVNEFRPRITNCLI